MPKTRIYIAGPYSKGDVAVNVRQAMTAWDVLAAYGFAPYCPHLSHFLHLLHPHPLEFWYEHDNEWLRMCEVLVRLPGVSAGADAEVALAHELGLRVYAGVDDLIRGELAR